MGGFRHLDIFTLQYLWVFLVHTLSISIKLYFPYTFSISEAERLRRPSFKILNKKYLIRWSFLWPLTYRGVNNKMHSGCNNSYIRVVFILRNERDVWPTSTREVQQKPSITDYGSLLCSTRHTIPNNPMIRDRLWSSHNLLVVYKSIIKVPMI